MTKKNLEISMLENYQRLRSEPKNMSSYKSEEGEDERK